MNLFDTIRNTIVPIHKEGYVFVAAFFVASLVLGWIAEPLFWVGLVLTAWCAYFFRDPERVTPQDDDLIISPADPHSRRGDLGARHPHRTGNPERARYRLEEPHDAGYRPPPFHRHRRG